MSNDIKHNIKQQSTWKRGLYILLFAFLYGIADVILFAVVLFQFFHKLFTGDTNDRLQQLGQSIGTYIYQIIQYLTFNSDYHPYPLGEWPQGEPEIEVVKKAKTVKTAVKKARKKVAKKTDVEED